MHDLLIDVHEPGAEASEVNPSPEMKATPEEESFDDCLNPSLTEKARLAPWPNEDVAWTKKVDTRESVR